MKLYEYHPNANHYNGYRLGEKDFEKKVFDLHYESRSVARTWKPVRAKAEFGNPGDDGDFPGLCNFDHIPIFSERAWNLLKPLIGYCSEALPIKHPLGKPFFIINVMEIIDCLDEERSEIEWFEGKVFAVDCYCFKPGLLKGKHIFKTPQKSRAKLFVDEKFMELVEANDLKGLIFKEIPMKK